MSEPNATACIGCGGREDLMDVAFAPGMTYCKPCRVARSSESAAESASVVGFRRRWTYLSDYERGVLGGQRAALKALDGHGFHDTAHDRVRALLACAECGHQPEDHDEQGVCHKVTAVDGPNVYRCVCIEWEPPVTQQGDQP